MTLSSPSSIRRTGSRSLVVIIELVAYMWILVVAIIFRARCGLLRGCGDDCEPCKSGRSWCWSGCDSSGPKELCIRWGSRSPYAKGKFLGAKTWTRVIPRKHVLSGVHTGSTWQIPLNHPCAVAMRLWPLVICVMFIWYVCFMILFIIWYLIIRCILLYVVMSAVWRMFTNQRSECHGDESWCENNEHCLWLHAGNDEMFCSYLLSFGSLPSNHYFRSVCWFVCLFVCAVFLTRLWTDFDQTWTYVICLGLVVSPRI